MAVACTSERYVVVDVDTARAAAVAHLAVTVVGDEDRISQVIFDGGDTTLRFPGSFSLGLPDGYDGSVTVIVEARGAADERLDRRIAHITAVTHEVERTRVVLFEGGPCPTAASGELCEDFEDSVFDPAVWDVTDATRVMIDGTRAHSGRRSLHLELPALTGGVNEIAALQNRSVFATGLTGDVWIRAWTYLTTQPTQYTSILLLGRNTPTYEQNFIALKPTSIALTTIDNGIETPATLPLGQWTCLVWQLDLSTAVGGATLSGSELPTIGPVAGKTQDDPPLEKLSLQAQVTNAQPQEAFELWFDDVRVSPAPLDCLSAPGT
jgi:hypothetical protein